MKRLHVLVTIICIALILSGCSVSISPEASMKSIREFLCSCENTDMRAAITADYGDKIFEYTVKYSGSGTSGDIEIITPEIIAGICAHVSFDDGIKLEFDGAVLDTGSLYEDGLSPVDAIPMMLTQWQKGYISEYSFEKHDGTDCTAATITVSDEVSLRTWFDSETYLPMYAEIAYNGFVIIKCDFENISMY